MGLLISPLAKTPKQVVVVSLVLMFFLSGLAGAWMPLEVTGDAFQKVAYLTPLSWSMTGFRNVIEKGQDFKSVLFPVAIITDSLCLYLVWQSGDLDTKKLSAREK